MPKNQNNKKAKGSSNIFTRAASKFSKMHKSAQILILALTVGIVGGGGFAVYNSYAATAYLTSGQCYLLGRVYVGGSGNPCSSTCISGAGSMVVASPYNYCSGAVSKISSTTCSANGRVWINNGCARRWQQTNLAGAPQCVSSSMTYTVTSTTDKCVASTPSILGDVIFYKDANYGGNWTFSQAVGQYDTTFNILAFTGQSINVFSSVKNQSPVTACLYNSSKTRILKVNPWTNVPYVGDAANDKAAYYAINC